MIIGVICSLHLAILTTISAITFAAACAVAALLDGGDFFA
jgi:hypothetical protein